MADDGAKVTDELNCRCKKSAKCPRIRWFEDGSMLVTDEERGATPVRFDREQVQELLDRLRAREAG